jgi:hypothetical protein
LALPSGGGRRSIPTTTVDPRRPHGVQSSATSISDELDLSHEDSTGDRSNELAAQLDYLRRMSRYEHLMDEHDREGSTGELTRTIEEDPFVQLTSGIDDGEMLASNYLSVVREEPLSSDEQEHEEEEDREKKKKRKQKTNSDDDQPLKERHDDDNDDDDEQKGNRPSMLTSTTFTAETSQADSKQQSTSATESSQGSTEQQQQQMDMSYDSINDFMMMSQDSLKQRSNESLNSEHELPSLTPTGASNETDEFVLNQHNMEPTPSQMLGKYDDDDDFQRTKSATELQYPLISNELEIGQLPVIHARRTAIHRPLHRSTTTIRCRPRASPIKMN